MNLINDGLRCARNVISKLMQILKAILIRHLSFDIHHSRKTSEYKSNTKMLFEQTESFF